MDDLISRQAAIDALAENMPSLTTPDGCGQFDHDIQVTDEAYVDCMQIIHELPPAQPGCEDAVYRKAVQMLLAYFVPEERYAEAVDGLRRLPPAQPEIIHCKDCKYNSNPPECGNAACVLFYGMTDQMGFCHHGERRERE